MLAMKFQKSKDLETKWHKTLMNMPNGVTLYQVNTQKVIFHNNFYPEIFSHEPDLLPQSDNPIPITDEELS